MTEPLTLVVTTTIVPADCGWLVTVDTTAEPLTLVVTTTTVPADWD